MRRTILLVVTMALTLLVASGVALAVIMPGAAMAQSPGTGASKDEQPTFKPQANEQFVEGQVIVKFKPSASLPEEAAIRRQEGLEKKKDLGLIDAEVDKIQGQSVEQAVRGLEGRPNVQYAQPDFIVRVTGYADEPRFSELWGLHNTGQTIFDSPGVADVDVNALEASAVTQGDRNLVVAVIDTGVDFSHPDLSERRWVNTGESGGGKETNGIDDDGNGFVDDVNGADFANNDGNPFDDNRHGTHVSGTIAGSVNDQGIVGVAPNVKIMALKVLNASAEGSTSDAIEAITYAKNKGAKISNNSWGVGGGDFPALKDAIEASGSLFVAGAGNGGSDFIGDDNDVTPFYPASYNSPNILSVAAINNQGNLGFFSNFGATSVDISAPGVNILSTFPGNSYAYLMGTSMATPHAAGVAALAASVDPALLSDPVALKNHVMDTGKPVPATSGKTVTGDMVDAKAAVDGESTPPQVKRVVPQEDAMGIGPRANVSAIFTEAMEAGSINTNTVKLSKAGTTTTIVAAVSYDATAKKAILNPDAKLQLGTKYKAVVTTRAKDLAGNRLDQNKDPSDGLQQKAWTFTIRN